MAAYGERLVCDWKDCNQVFTVTHHHQKYCATHRTTNRRKAVAEAIEAGEPLPSKLNSANRQCANPRCKKAIRGKRALNKRVKYHDDACAIQAQQDRKNEKRRVDHDKQILDHSGREFSESVRRGEVYERLVATGDAESIDSGVVSAAAIAELYNSTPASISRAMEAWRHTQTMEEAAKDWKQSCRIQAMFPKEKLERIRELGEDPTNESLPEFQQLADELTRAYTVMSRRYFLLERKRPIIKEFHKKWIRSIIVAYAIGGKQLILSPPRHGKSETLIRLFVWVIIMDPLVRIGWLAASKDIAKIMLGAVKAQLVDNEQLLKDTLPPGDVYKPAWGSSKPWSVFELTVATNHAIQKSSTMLALGRTSKILSRDFDMLAVDDIEDWDTVRDQHQRDYSKEKFIEFGTRKEERTVWFNIGSRQHPDDIPAALIEAPTDPDGLDWNVIVDSAHDDACELDPEVIDGHDENGCVLFPEVRTYRWLMEKQREEIQLGIEGRYEMRYLNKPRPTTGLVFDMKLIEENALNPSRGIGLDELPDGTLIAGLDPAPRGVQAAVLWHYANGKLSIVDIETQEAGGFAGALRVMREWFDKYGLTDWVYEDNAQQTEFFRDPRVKDLKRELGLTIKDHTTGPNKQDPELGISAMAPLYHDGTIDLPYGTAEARRKVKVLLQQLKLWTTDGVARGLGKTDVKMASWFPFPRLLRWLRNTEHNQTDIAPPKEASYPNAGRLTNPSWKTSYPGR